jgi:4-amino-4-deoxy-L-arabinose transferase-like glycosyltransferase
MRLSDKHLQIGTAVLLIFAILSGIHLMELRGEEPRRAAISLEMLINGDFVHPTLLGWSYYNKPPVYNWIMASLFWVFGNTSEFLVRLPGVLSFLATGLLIYRFSRKQLGTQAAFLAATLFLISIDLFFYGAIVAGEIDLFYTLILFVQLASLYVGYTKKKWLWLFVISYAMVAIGMLTKGLPSLFHQGVSLIALAVYYRNYRFLFSWQHLVGGTLFLVIFCGYFYFYDKSGTVENYLLTMFYESQNKSGVDKSFFDILGGLVLFPFQVLFLLLPGSIILISLFWNRSKKPNILSKPIIKYCLLIIGINILVYWLSPGVRNRYLYILFPFFTIIFAAIWENKRPVTYRFALFVVLAFAVFRIGYNFIGIPYQQSLFYYRDTMNEMMEITQNEQIYYLDVKRSVQFDYPLGLSAQMISYDLPANISYRIPYYTTRKNRMTLQFTETPIPGAFHLVRSNNLPSSNYERLFEITRGKDDDLVLIKFNGKSDPKDKN